MTSSHKILSGSRRSNKQSLKIIIKTQQNANCNFPSEKKRAYNNEGHLRCIFRIFGLWGCISEMGNLTSNFKRKRRSLMEWWKQRLWQKRLCIFIWIERITRFKWSQFMKSATDRALFRILTMLLIQPWSISLVAVINAFSPEWVDGWLACEVAFSFWIHRVLQDWPIKLIAYFQTHFKWRQFIQNLEYLLILFWNK